MGWSELRPPSEGYSWCRRCHSTRSLATPVGWALLLCARMSCPCCTSATLVGALCLPLPLRRASTGGLCGAVQHHHETDLHYSLPGTCTCTSSLSGVAHPFAWCTLERLLTHACCRLRPGAAGFEDGTSAYLAIAALRHGFAQLQRVGGFPAIAQHTCSLSRCDQQVCRSIQ